MTIAHRITKSELDNFFYEIDHLNPPLSMDLQLQKIRELANDNANIIVGETKAYLRSKICDLESLIALSKG